MDDYLKHTKETLKKLTDEVEEKEILEDGNEWYPGADSFKKFMSENKNATFVQVPHDMIYHGEDPEEKKLIATALESLKAYYLDAFNAVIDMSIDQGILFNDSFRQLSTTHQIVMSQLYKKIIDEKNGDKS